MARRLTSYSDVLPLLEGLQVAVTEARRRDGMSLRDLADATGASLNSLSRYERGADISLSTVLKLVRWLAKPGGTGMGGEP